MLSGSHEKSLLPRELLGVGVFVASYMAAAVVRAVYARNVEFLFYIAVMLLLIVAVVLIHRRVALSPGLLWALAVWGGMHMAGGLVPLPESWPIEGDMRVLYSWWIVPKQAGGTAGGWLKYDQLTHAYGFGVTTWLCWQGLRGALTGYRRAGRGVEPTIGLMVITAAAGAGFGALNEIVEFIATRITITNVGGYENTGWDLVYNAVGALIAVGLIYAFRRRGKVSDTERTEARG